MRAVEPWVEGPVTAFLAESQARLALLMTSSGQVVAQLTGLEAQAQDLAMPKAPSAGLEGQAAVTAAVAASSEAPPVS